MRKLSTTRTGWIHLVVAATLVANGVPVVAVADTSSTNPMPVSGAGPSQLPSSFTNMDMTSLSSTANAMACNDTAGSLMNGVGNAVNSLAGSASAGAFGSTMGMLGAGAAAITAGVGACDGPEDAPSGGGGGGGGSCMAAAASAVAQGIAIQKVIDTIKCKQNALKQVANQVNCMMQRAEMLNRQVASIQDMFVANMQRYQRDVGQMKQTIMDIKNQRRDVDTLLNGDANDQETPDPNNNGGTVTTHNKGVTTPGINKMRQLFMDYLIGGDTVTGSSAGGGDNGSQMPNAPGGQGCGANASLPCLTTMLDSKVKNLEAEKEKLEADVQADITSQSMSCFDKQVIPSFRCTPNGPPVSAKDYMSCRYKQNQQVGKNGVIDTSASKQADADASKQGLDAILADMLAQGPKALDNPSKLPSGDPNDAAAIQEGVNNADKQTSQYATTADLVKAYKDKLAGYTVSGVNLGSFFEKQMMYCDSQSQAKVTALRNRAGSRYELRQRSIKANEQTINTAFNTTVSKSAKLWADGIRSMSGQNAPLDTSACNKSDMNVKLACLKDLQTNLDGLLEGITPASSMNMSIKGTALAPSVNFTCMGLNGCATSLNNLNNNLKDKSRQIEQFKTQYVQLANQSVVSFIQSAAKALSPASAAINAQITALNTQLSTLGAKRLTVKSMDPEELKDDKSLDGLYMIPKNAINLIGGKGRMNPPLPNLEDDGLNQGLEGISEREKELSQKLGQATSAQMQAAQSVASCKDQQDQKDQNLANQWDAAGCSGALSCDDPYQKIGESFVTDKGSADLSTGQQCGAGAGTGQGPSATYADQARCRKIAQSMQKANNSGGYGGGSSGGGGSGAADGLSSGSGDQ